MKIEHVKISEIKPNPDNPRIIKNDKYAKLVKSIKEFPQMLEIRPIVVDAEGMVLGGNMRLKACKEAGLKQVPIIRASELTEEQKREFIVKDNVAFGEWDWDSLANAWDDLPLEDWAVDVWRPEEEPDYSLLDEGDEIDDTLSDMTDGVKKAIQIEFDLEHYNTAAELVKFWRNQGAYVGKMIIDHLQAEKQKL